MYEIKSLFIYFETTIALDLLHLLVLSPAPVVLSVGNSTKMAPLKQNAINFRLGIGPYHGYIYYCINNNYTCMVSYLFLYIWNYLIFLHFTIVLTIRPLTFHKYYHQHLHVAEFFLSWELNYRWKSTFLWLFWKWCPIWW